MLLRIISDMDIPKQSKIRSLSFGYTLHHIVYKVSGLPLRLCFAYGNMKISMQLLNTHHLVEKTVRVEEIIQLECNISIDRFQVANLELTNHQITKDSGHQFTLWKGKLQLLLLFHLIHNTHLDAPEPSPLTQTFLPLGLH